MGSCEPLYTATSTATALVQAPYTALGTGVADAPRPSGSSWVLP